MFSNHSNHILKWSRLASQSWSVYVLNLGLNLLLLAATMLHYRHQKLKDDTRSYIRKAAPLFCVHNNTEQIIPSGIVSLNKQLCRH